MKTLIRKILSRPIFQPIFEFILKFTLKVLNIGEGQSVATSGECHVFKLVGENPVVLDVGAHTGEWYMEFRKQAKGKPSVFSFEPSKDAFQKLNNIGDENFKAFNIALGNQSGYVHLASAGESTGHISETGEEVEIAALDEFCKKHNIQHIDLLKLDVEGYELKVLEGAKDMLPNIKMVQFEFGAPSEEKYSLKDFFEVLGDYDIYRILANGMYKVTYSHIFEILTVTNFVAIRR